MQILASRWPPVGCALNRTLINAAVGVWSGQNPDHDPRNQNLRPPTNRAHVGIFSGTLSVGLWPEAMAKSFGTSSKPEHAHTSFGELCPTIGKKDVWNLVVLPRFCVQIVRSTPASQPSVCHVATYCGPASVPMIGFSTVGASRWYLHVPASV